MSTATLGATPFGGRSGKSSGVGRVGGRQAMETFIEPKTVVVTL